VSLGFREHIGLEVTIGDIQDCFVAMNVASEERFLVLFGNCYRDGFCTALHSREWLSGKDCDRPLTQELLRPVAGRRNIYTWLFTLRLLTGAPASGFILLCLWAMATAAIRIVRALQIRLSILRG